MHKGRSVGVANVVCSKALDEKRQELYDLVQNITPFDAKEDAHKQGVLTWIASNAPLYRKEVNVPLKHLVAYSLLVDVEEKKLLLVDHKKASLWLPSGGHVDFEEHPKDTAHRELKEELGVELPLLFESPFFLTVTDTSESTTKHTDVSLWYLFRASSKDSFVFDTKEFCQIRWFSMDALPLERADPHIGRFVKKFAALSS